MVRGSLQPSAGRCWPEGTPNPEEILRLVRLTHSLRMTCCGKTLAQNDMFCGGDTLPTCHPERTSPRESRMGLLMVRGSPQPSAGRCWPEGTPNPEEILRLVRLTHSLRMTCCGKTLAQNDKVLCLWEGLALDQSRRDPVLGRNGDACRLSFDQRVGAGGPTKNRHRVKAVACDGEIEEVFG